MPSLRKWSKNSGIPQAILLGVLVFVFFLEIQTKETLSLKKKSKYWCLCGFFIWNSEWKQRFLLKNPGNPGLIFIKKFGNPTGGGGKFMWNSPMNVTTKLQHSALVLRRSAFFIIVVIFQFLKQKEIVSDNVLENNYGFGADMIDWMVLKSTTYTKRN